MLKIQKILFENPLTNSLTNSLENPPTYTKRDLYLDKITYGIFEKKSYIPITINTFYHKNFNINDFDRNIVIKENEIVKILLFVKRKIRHKTEYEDDDSPMQSSDEYYTEDLTFQNIYIE